MVADVTPPLTRPHGGGKNMTVQSRLVIENKNEQNVILSLVPARGGGGNANLIVIVSDEKIFCGRRNQQ